jgi:hypothetical protein
MKPEELTKLYQSVRSIQEWLNFKIRTGKCSFGFVVELAQHLAHRVYNVHTIYDEIGILEGDNTRPSNTKPAKPFTRPPLVGLWHKHHHQARFMLKNLELEWKTEGFAAAALTPHIGRFVDEAAGEIAHEVVIGAFLRRAALRRLTSEFIVYERREDGSNYYLTLGSHGDYLNIRTRVDVYRHFDLEQENSANSEPDDR